MTDVAQFFDARPSQFDALMGNGQKFVIPPFQRHYSWDEDNWQALWDDILKIHQGETQIHYLGNVLLMKQGNKVYDVIDGQQRLVTVSIMIIAFLYYLQKLINDGKDSEKNQHGFDELYRNYIVTFDFNNNLYNAKLTLNAHNKYYYKYELSQMKFKRPGYNEGYRQILFKTFEFFKDKIKEDLPDITQDGLKIYEFVRQVILEKLAVVRIEVSSMENAYIFFESLNSAGEPLSTADMIKNMLFAKYADNYDQINDKWGELEQLSNNNLPSIIRGYELPDTIISKRKLFFEIKNKYQNKQAHEVLEYVDSLIYYAHNNNALMDNNHQQWAGDIDLKLLITEYNQLGLYQFNPALIVASDKKNNEFLRAMLRIFINHIFRYQIIGKKRTNILEPIYHHIAKKIMEQSNYNKNDLQQDLTPIRIENAQFIADFAEFLTDKTRIIQYILAKYHQISLPLSTSYTIEHIMKKSTKNQYIWRLGNLALLEYSLNKQAGDKEYADKIPFYQQSQLPEIKDLANNYPDWGETEIIRRQEKMAKVACDIWNI